MGKYIIIHELQKKTAIIMNIVKSSELHLHDVPKSDSEIKFIKEFALTFDIHESHNYVSISDKLEDLSISDLRFILYTEQRRWNHFNRQFDEKTEQLLRKLISLIRSKVNK